MQEIGFEIKKIELKMMESSISKLQNPFNRGPNEISFSTSPVNSNKTNVIKNRSLKKEFEEYQNENEISKIVQRRSSQKEKIDSKYINVLKSLGKCASESYFFGNPQQSSIRNLNNNTRVQNSVSYNHSHKFQSECSPKIKGEIAKSSRNKSFSKIKERASRRRKQGSARRGKMGRASSGIANNSEHIGDMTNVNVIKRLKKHRADFEQSGKDKGLFKRKKSRKENRVKSASKKRSKLRRSLKSHNLKKSLGKQKLTGASKAALIRTLKELGVLKDSAFDYTVSFKSKKVFFFLENEILRNCCL